MFCIAILRFLFVFERANILKGTYTVLMFLKSFVSPPHPTLDPPLPR